MTQPDTNANRLVGITAASSGKPTLHLRATVANCHLEVVSSKEVVRSGLGFSRSNPQRATSQLT